MNEYMRSEQPRVTNWESFREHMAWYVRFIENRVLRVKGDFPVDLNQDWGRASRLMMQEYGPNGGKTAYDRVRTGINGGLGCVLRAIGERMANEYSQNEINARVSMYLKSLSPSEHLEAAREYLAKYGHLLPPEMTEAGGLRIQAYFPLFLKQHPQIMQTLRRVGR